MSVLTCILIGAAISLALLAWLRDEFSVGGFLFTLSTLCFFSWLFFGEETESGKQHRAEQAARDKAARTPHVIREADGCKTYRVEIEGRWHYYTRCGNQTTHDAPRTVTCGKSCTKTVVDSITTTEGNNDD